MFYLLKTAVLLKTGLYKEMLKTKMKTKSLKNINIADQSVNFDLTLMQIAVILKNNQTQTQ